MELYYYGLKTLLFGSLIRVFIVAEPMRRHVLAMSFLYTLLVAFLSYVFLLSQFEQPNYRLWQIWLGVNFVMTFIYFKLLTRFDESVLFWFILPLAVPIIFNEPNLVPIWKTLLGGALHAA
ncbi:MAG: hypothetical protein KatS3mg108_0976 [Isosphaeraceae bacterium]|nr:MAG: hypothetical protein KatS3mg108_0976 [Isosphaeraceae bacterium]